MSFVIKIFFIGLIAFVPSEDGSELTVLLVDSRHPHELSDGSDLPAHRPLLLVRAGSCAGNCGSQDETIARFIFPGNPAAADGLSAALASGLAWPLDGSEIAIAPVAAGQGFTPPPLVIKDGVRRQANGRPAPTPATSAEREDFDWVANLEEIAPDAGQVQDGLIDGTPPPGRIAARFKLRTGEVTSARLIGIGGEVRPIEFRPLDGDGSETAYRQAVADWVVAEIHVAGDTVAIRESPFGGEGRRQATLSPEPGEPRTIEIALLNVPADFFEVDPDPDQNGPEPGRHFEMYYRLSRKPPAAGHRPVPFPTTEKSETLWDTVHPPGVPPLLASILVDDPRGSYDRTLCPVTEMEP